MALVSFSPSFFLFFFFFILRSFSLLVILFSGTVFADPILRDIEDSFGDDVCLAESPTIARDLAETRPQRCFTHREIVPPSNRLIRSKVVYETRRVLAKGCKVHLKTRLYDSFAKRWQSSPAFPHSGSHMLVDVTSYTRGKLFILEFENCWFLIKIYGMDTVPPTPIWPTVRSTSRLSTRVLTSTTRSATNTHIPTRSGFTARTIRTIRIESTTPLTTLITWINRTTSFAGPTSWTVSTTSRASTTTSFIGTTPRATSIGMGTTSTSITTLSSTTRKTSPDTGSTVPTQTVFTTVPVTRIWPFSTGKWTESTSSHYISTDGVTTVGRWTISTTAIPSMDNRLVLGLSTASGIVALVFVLVLVYRFCILPRRRVIDDPGAVTGSSIDQTNGQTDGKNNDGADLEMEGIDETEMTVLDVDGGDNTSIGSSMSHVALIDDIVF